MHAEGMCDIHDILQAGLERLAKASPLPSPPPPPPFCGLGPQLGAGQGTSLGILLEPCAQTMKPEVSLLARHPQN